MRFKGWCALCALVMCVSWMLLAPARAESVAFTHGDVAMHSAPSPDAQVIARIAGGSQMTVLDASGDWWHVSFGPLTGYMEAASLDVPGGVSPVPTAGPAAASTADAAFTPSSPYRFAPDEAVLVHQVGYSESLVDYQAHLSTSIFYPVTGVPAMDEAIVRWAKDTHAVHLASLEDLSNAHPEADAESELTVHYNAYLTDRYVGVLEAGWYRSPFLAREEDVLRTFNADLSTGQLLTYGDIFRRDRLNDVCALLASRLAQISALEGDMPEVDVGWLQNLVLTDTGVAIALARGEYLPAYLGAQLVVLPYAEIADLMQIPVPQARPQTPQPAKTDAPQTGPRTIDPTRPMVALTFDDGPSEYTSEILDLLTQYGGAATFCVVGNRISSYPDQIRAIAAQGSEIATHTWSHQKLTSLGAESMERQIVRPIEAVHEIVDVPVRFIRPPYGSVDSNVRAVARKLGMPIVLWSIDTEDWRTMNADKTARAILKNVKNGSIVLMHDVHQPTLQAMRTVIPELAARGYQMVTLSELYSVREGGAQPGVVYSHLDPNKIVTKR